jgi:hypothetical protein
MTDFQITDMDHGPESWTPEPEQAALNDTYNFWKSLVLGKWPNCDGILAWFLYQLGSEFLVRGDLDAVGDILEILHPLDHNLAALLSSKVGYQIP